MIQQKTKSFVFSNELLNSSLFEFILPDDYDQLRDYFLKDHDGWRRNTKIE